VERAPELVEVGMADKDAHPALSPERLCHPPRLAHPGRCGGYLVVLLSVALAFKVMLTTDTIPDAAIAAVTAAVIGVVGTRLGHKIGYQHGRQRPRPRQRGWVAILFDFALVIAIVVSVLGLGFSILVSRWASRRLGGVEDEAIAGLITALLGVPGADLANERQLEPFITRWVGPAVIGLSIAGGMFLIAQNHWQLDAEGIAAFVGAGVTIGGTFLGHATGEELARA
jgi:hypothetical protein